MSRLMGSLDDFSMPLVIAWITGTLGDVDAHRPGINGYEIPVEQCVQIPAQQQPVLHMVGVFALIRVNVRSFERFRHHAAGDAAAPTIHQLKRAAESRLSRAAPNHLRRLPCKFR